ncbi:MAG: response regulator [Oscillospiraceae bacterium]|nr:response regulator [Oscillospiraceae bacterium]
MSDFSPSVRKEKILIVDDSEMNRLILEDILEDDYDVVHAENGAKAVELLKKMSSEFSLVMLDMVMPEMDGFDVLNIMNQYHWIENLPVIMISVENSANYIERAYDMGVTDYIRRPFDAISVRRRVINTIKLYANQRKLVSLVADQIYEKEKNNSMMVTILSHIVEFRNGESGMHVLHVRTITETILTRLVAKYENIKLTRADISMISLASALHDIGKIMIPDEVLNKPGKLTNEEFAIMKKHSMMGADMLADLPFKDEPIVKTSYEICRWHHERYDGRGYPDGLVGDAIPLSAQVVSVADVYDALTSERVYKKAFSHEKAMEMILGGECGAFNPMILECLKEVASQLREELTTGSNASKSRQDVQEITETMLKSNEISFSEQMTGMLDMERVKYQFLSSISREIQFDYVDDPSVLTMPKWSAEKLGLQENVIDPKKNEKVLEIFSIDRINEMSALIHSTTPDDPVVEYGCELKLDGQTKPYKIICRSVWSGGSNMRYIGAVGKVIDESSANSSNIDVGDISNHDPLTGLYSVRYAKTRIAEIMEENPEKDYMLAMVSLMKLRTVGSGKLTHFFRDAVLKITAKKLTGLIGTEDIAARIDENNFMIFIPCGGDDRIAEIMKGMSYSYGNFSISCNIGAASTKYSERRFATLYGDAFKALESVTDSEGGGYHIYGRDKA